MGLSLHPILDLRTRILGVPARPGRSTIQCGIQAAASAAGRVLKLLDARCQAWVLVGGLEEICWLFAESSGWFSEFWQHTGKYL